MEICLVVQNNKVGDRISIAFCGDVMLGGEFENLKTKHKIRYEDLFFSLFKSLTDVTAFVFNLETTLSKSSDPRSDKSSLLYSPPESLFSMKNLNCNKIVSLANNHISDFGVRSFEETIRILEKNQFFYFGAGKDTEEAQKPLFIKLNDETFAFLAFTTDKINVKSILATRRSFGCASINESEMISAINEAKAVTENICVIFHWGYEFFRFPSPKQRALAKLAIDMGSKIVIGHHPHVIQGIEWHKNCPILYSLGNFFFPDFRHKDGTGSLHQWSSTSRVGILAIIDFHLDKQTELRVIPLKDIKTEVIFHNEPKKVQKLIKEISLPFNWEEEKYKHFWYEYHRKKTAEIIKKAHDEHKKELAILIREKEFLGPISKIRPKTISYILNFLKNEAISKIRKYIY